MPIIAIGDLELNYNDRGLRFLVLVPSVRPALGQAHHSARATSFSPQMRSLKQPDAAGKIEHRKRQDCTQFKPDGAQALP